MTDSNLRAIATLEMALGASRDVPGMADFANDFLKSQPLKARKMMHRYLKLKEEERLAFIKAAEADGWDKPPVKKDS